MHSILSPKSWLRRRSSGLPCSQCVASRNGSPIHVAKFSPFVYETHRTSPDSRNPPPSLHVLRICGGAASLTNTLDSPWIRLPNAAYSLHAIQYAAASTTEYALGVAAPSSRKLPRMQSTPPSHSTSTINKPEPTALRSTTDALRGKCSPSPLIQLHHPLVYQKLTNNRTYDFIPQTMPSLRETRTYVQSNGTQRHHQWHSLTCLGRLLVIESCTYLLEEVDFHRPVPR